MNMQELAARYERQAKALRLKIINNPTGDYTVRSMTVEALMGCAVYIGDNATAEEAVDELELACALADTLSKCGKFPAEHADIWRGYCRQAVIYKRAIAMVKRCEGAA